MKNEGLAYHDFKICVTPVKNAARNACVGVQTKLLHPGQTATLTVKLTKKGLYEYICSVPGHAKAGMKGLIGVGVVYKPKTVVTVPTTTTTTTTTTSTQPMTTAATTTTTSGGGGDASQDPACPAGQTIKSTTGGNGDGDNDETGFPSDGDGCV